MFWYYNPILKGSGVWSKPYKDIYTGYHMISYTKPVYLEGQLFGVAGIDIVFENIMEMINSVKIGETGYGYLLDNNLDFIVHPKMEDDGQWDNKNLHDLDKNQYIDLVNKLSEQSSGVAEVGHGYNKKIAGFSHMGNGYLVVIEANSSEIMEGLNRVITIIDAIMLFGILIAALAAYNLGKFISKPLDRLGKMIKRMMHFDFSSEINDMELIDTSSDSGMMIVELSKLRESVNNSIIMLRNNSNSMNINLEQIEKYLIRCRNFIEKIECQEGVDDNTKAFHSIEINQLKGYIKEIEKLLEDLKRSNIKNNSITALYKTD